MTEQEIQILEAMLDRIEKCEETNKMLMNSSSEIIKSRLVLSETIELMEKKIEMLSANNIYEILDPRNSIVTPFYPDICSAFDTLEELVSGEKSMCRFGDGEFACINGRLRANFTTKYYEQLSIRLKQILKSDNDTIMIAIADNYGNLAQYIPKARWEIRSYMTSGIRKEHERLLSAERVYYNAYVTRPHIMFGDNYADMMHYFEKFKNLWYGKSVVIIEGRNTGFGVGNDLLKGCSSIKRIIVPSIDAFECYDEIYGAALKQAEDSLYLAAVGPVATVLAYDLAMTGRRAVDIGHLDIEYEWLLRRNYRCAIPGKYVNEIKGCTNPESIEDEEYKRQIVELVGDNYL